MDKFMKEALYQRECWAF